MSIEKYIQEQSRMNKDRNAVHVEQKISDFFSSEQKDLVVRGLQALWRERTAAFNLAMDLPGNADKTLSRVDFGVPEIEAELRRWGARPQKY